MNIRQKVLFFSALFLTAFIGGCGYSTGSLLPSHFKTIYVDNFKNKIDIGKEVTESSRYALYRPGLENDVTNEVVERFAFDGNLKIESKEKADMILKGSLTSYNLEPLRYDENDNVEEYRVRISVNLELIDVKSDEVMWTETNFGGEETYISRGRFATSEETARQQALEDLARRIVERTIECW